MASQISASFQLLLPEQVKERVTAIAEVTAAWGKFLEAMEPYQADLSFNISDVRTSTPLNKRGRKNRISHPHLVSEPSTAA